MARPRAFLFNVDDWLSSYAVEKMTGDQVKAYMYLLCRSWTELPLATLPNDDVELATMARVTPEKWTTIKDDILLQFRSTKNGRIYHPRLRIEADFIAAKSFAGKSGWTTKRRKAQAKTGKENVTNLKQFRGSDR